MRRDYRFAHNRIQTARRRRTRRRKGKGLQPMEAHIPRRATSKPKHLLVMTHKRKHPRRKSYNWGLKCDLPDKKRKLIRWWHDVDEGEL